MTAGRPPAAGLRGSAEPLVRAYDVALLDLDGVVYLGSRPVDGAIAAIAAARAQGMRFAFVTNNASRTPTAVADRLAAMGLPASPDEVVTSAQAAARLVAERFGGGVPVLPVGGEGLREALRAVGGELVASADDEPAAVVQGFAAELRYADLAEAALAVARGAWWVATNADLTLPTDRGLLPGNGALVGAVATAAGRGPDAVAGKPERALLAEALRRTGATCPLMVGDRFDTDIEGAVRGGVDSLWVSTGVASGADLVRAPVGRRPSYVGADVRALLDAHEAPVRDGAGWRCGEWRAEVRDEEVHAWRSAGGEAVDLLRVTAAAAWASADAGRPVSGVRLSPADVSAARSVGLDRLLTAGDAPVG